MEPFSIYCTTCKTRLKVRDEAAIGKLLDCPKCGAFVLVESPNDWRGGDEGNYQTTVVAPDGLESSGGLAPPVPAAIPPEILADPNTFVSGPPLVRSDLPTLTGYPPVSTVTPEIEPPVDAPPMAAESSFEPPLEQPAVAVAEAVVQTPSESAQVAAELSAPRGSSLSQLLLMAGAAVAGVVLALGLFVFAIWMFSGEQPIAQAGNPTAHSPTVHSPADVPKVPKVAEPAKTPDPVKPVEPAVVERPETTEPAKEPDEPAPKPSADSPAVPEVTGPAKPVTVEGDIPIEPKPVEPADPKSVASALKKFAPFLDDLPLPDGDSPGVSPPVKPVEPVEPDPSPRPAAPVRMRPEPRKVDVAARLADKLAQVEFTSVPLVDFLQFVTDLSTLPITLDPEALQFVGKTPDSTISVNLRDASVGVMLKEALAPLGLACETAAGGLVVVRAGPADGKLRSSTYTVADLVGDDPEQLQTLAAWTVALIAPDSWASSGGPGTLEANAEKQALVVSQSEAVHFQLVLFCEKLRVARGQAPRSKFDKALFRLDPRVGRAGSQLATPITLNFSQPAPLVRILERLGKTAGVRIVVDWQSAALVGWSPEAEGTVVADKLSLADTLTALLKPMDLAFRVADDGVLQVVSQQTFDTRLELEIYPVADLLNDKLDGERLAARVKAALGEDLFPVGGPGAALHFDPPGKCLLVSLPQPRHADLVRLLAEMRASK